MASRTCASCGGRKDCRDSEWATEISNGLTGRDAEDTAWASEQWILFETTVDNIVYATKFCSAAYYCSFRKEYCMLSVNTNALQFWLTIEFVSNYGDNYLSIIMTSSGASNIAFAFHSCVLKSRIDLSILFINHYKYAHRKSVGNVKEWKNRALSSAQIWHTRQ